METMTKDKALLSPEQAAVDQLVDAGLLDELRSELILHEIELRSGGPTPTDLLP